MHKKVGQIHVKQIKMTIKKFTVIIFSLSGGNSVGFDMYCCQSGSF